MSTSRIKTTCKLLISLAAVCASLVGIWTGLRYILADEASSYTRVMMHELNAQKEIDTLLCGSSLCYRGFDTALLDEELEGNCFNAGSTTQGIAVSYYLLKDTLRKHKVGHIYLELCPVGEIQYDYKENPHALAGIYFISDYMGWSLPKLELLLTSTSPDYYPNGFLVARRYWQKILNFGYIRRVVKSKGTKAYREYAYDLLRHETEWYAGKGFVESCARVSEEEMNDVNANLVYDSLHEEWYDYAEKIVGLCRKKGVGITLVCAPVSRYARSRWEGWYDSYHDMVEDLAKKSGVDFWDFNLVKDEYFRADAENYMDSVHLNMYGARLFSKLFARLVRGELRYDEICTGSPVGHAR